MRKHIQLNTPEPCHQSWDQMTPVDKGRFCGSCQKQVVDFTSMSDAQLAHFFKKPSTGSVCGRFMQDQLNRTIDIPKKRIPWVKYFFQFALPAFLLSSKAVAQGKVKMLQGTPIIVFPAITGEMEHITVPDIERTIRGKIIDKRKEGIPYASVFIKEATLGVAADGAGNFSIKYTGVEDSIVLISSCVGFQEAHRVIKLNNQSASVVIEMLDNNPLEEIVLAGVIQVKKGRVVTGATSVVKTTNIFDTICNKIFPSKKLLNVYPNPVKRNTSLTIQTNEHEKGTYLFQLTALNGQIVLSKEKWMDKSDRVIQMEIPSIPAGTYFVSMINKQSGKSDKGKIIIE